MRHVCCSTVIDRQRGCRQVQSNKFSFSLLLLLLLPSHAVAVFETRVRQQPASPHPAQSSSSFHRFSSLPANLCGWSYSLITRSPVRDLRKNSSASFSSVGSDARPVALITSLIHNLYRNPLSAGHCISNVPTRSSILPPSSSILWYCHLPYPDTGSITATNHQLITRAEIRGSPCWKPVCLSFPRKRNTCPCSFTSARRRKERKK